MQRSVTYAFAAAIFLLLVPMLLRKMYTMLDPLLQSGLSEHDIRLYRYLLALQIISAMGQSDNHPTLEVDRIRQFIEEHKDGARVCPMCGRFYLANMAHCPYHHLLTRPIDHDVLVHQIGIWEQFRKTYVEATRIRGLTRVGTIRLHWHLTHKGEG
jgi:hypothetical protein